MDKKNEPKEKGIFDHLEILTEDELTKIEMFEDVNTPEENKIPIHKLAGETVSYNTLELKQSILRHDQFNPILLWFDKSVNGWVVVDGRHRLKACNQLGRIVITKHLKRSVKEDELPHVILSQQILVKGIDKQVAACEAVIYLAQTGETKASLLREFPRTLNSDDIKYLTVIRKVMPLWFNRIRNRDFVINSEVNNGKPTKSLRKLYDYCQEQLKINSEDNSNSGSDMDDEKKAAYIKRKEMEAVAYKQSSYLSAYIGNDEDSKRRIRLLFEEQKKTNAAMADYLDILSGSKELQKQRDYIYQLEQKVGAMEEVIELQKTLIPANKKTARKMRKITERVKDKYGR